MKKSFVSLLCVMLCFLVGMPGFAAKGEGVLPDPAELLGKEGTLYAEDYEFAEDYVCSAYFYETADDDFFNDYLGLAEDSGFDLYRTTVDDCDAFLMQYGGRDALLFPDFEGSMLLLVENGMEFAGAAKNDGPWLPDPCTASTTPPARGTTARPMISIPMILPPIIMPSRISSSLTRKP